MTTAIAIVIATAVVAVALIAAAAYIVAHEEHGGVLHASPYTEFHAADKGPEIVIPLNRYQMIKWIPVEEQLPDNSRHVLVSVNYAKGVDSIRISYWCGQAWYAIIGNVAAWAELPEPYRK